VILCGSVELSSNRAGHDSCRMPSDAKKPCDVVQKAYCVRQWVQDSHQTCIQMQTIRRVDTSASVWAAIAGNRREPQSQPASLQHGSRSLVLNELIPKTRRCKS
jgi:hypothetical protein